MLNGARPDLFSAAGLKPAPRYERRWLERVVQPFWGGHQCAHREGCCRLVNWGGVCAGQCTHTQTHIHTRRHTRPLTHMHHIIIYTPTQACIHARTNGHLPPLLPSRLLINAHALTHTLNALHFLINSLVHNHKIQKPAFALPRCSHMLLHVH